MPSSKEWMGRYNTWKTKEYIVVNTLHFKENIRKEEGERRRRGIGKGERYWGGE